MTERGPWAILGPSAPFCDRCLTRARWLRSVRDPGASAPRFECLCDLHKGIAEDAEKKGD